MIGNLLLLSRIKSRRDSGDHGRVRSCFIVSLSLSSASWRRSQNQKKHQDEINQQVSHHYLQASRVMSYVLFYSFFCGLVIFLFHSLHPSDQSSVQNLSAQPSVTAASSSRSEISSRLIRVIAVTLACLFKQITSVITSMASALKAAQDASAASAQPNQVEEDVISFVSGSHHGRQQSRSRCR